MRTGMRAMNSITDEEKKRVDGGRTDARKSFQVPMRFESASGRIFTGHTRDVSSSGAFLQVDSPADGVREGEEGVAFLEMQKGGNRFEVSFPCLVARVTEEGIALNFEADVED